MLILNSRLHVVVSKQSTGPTWWVNIDYYINALLLFVTIVFREVGHVIHDLVVCFMNGITNADYCCIHY